MIRKKIVTGYVPIPGHPRSCVEYGKAGVEFFSKLDCEGGNFTIHPFYENVKETWLWKFATRFFGTDIVPHSMGDNPAKNSFAYHCVQHQKFQWLVKAASMDPDADVYVWMDYGFVGVPGITPAIASEFMANIKADDFAIPGCWEKDAYLYTDANPYWRFCGGLMVVPRDILGQVYAAFRNEATIHIIETRNVTWEVNHMALAEPRWPSVRWYKADHNQEMFTNYGAALCEPQSSPHMFLSPLSTSPKTNTKSTESDSKMPATAA